VKCEERWKEDERVCACRERKEERRKGDRNEGSVGQKSKGNGKGKERLEGIVVRKMDKKRKSGV